MNSKERTCLLVKPDGVCQRHVGKVIDRLENAGLKLVGLKMMRLTQEQTERFYQEHRERPFFRPLVQFMTAAPIVATVWEGESAVRDIRSLIGLTDSSRAAEGTLRRQYGTDNRRNLVHASDSTASAAREISFFFTPGELFDYHENDWRSGDEQTLNSDTKGS